MKKWFPTLFTFLLAFPILLGSRESQSRTADSANNKENAEATIYVCPPCGSECDLVLHEKPGYCNNCAMRLIDKSNAENRPMNHSSANRPRVAILIFEGVQIIDFTGPYEVFGQAGFHVFTVAKDTETITTAMGMRVTPNHSLADCPAPDVVVIPGGNVTRIQNEDEVLEWIKTSYTSAEKVISVCNGAFILAKTGLLDGLSATTYYGLLDGLRALAPKVKVVDDQRFVENGKLMTTAGLSSGIDGALQIVAEMRGKGVAQSAALNMEYNWRPDLAFARAALADKYLSMLGRGTRLDLGDGLETRLLATAGDRDHWRSEWGAAGESDAAEVLNQVNTRLEQGGWSILDSRGNESERASFWQFKGGEGSDWQGKVTVEPMENHQFRVSVIINRQPRS